jgi:hypothetical protein
MLFTLDKNGVPFGFCKTNCRVQLRISGDAYRVDQFKKRHAWAADQKPVTVPVTEPAPVPGKKPVTVTVAGTVTGTVTEQDKKPVTVPVTEPAKKRSSMQDALAILGVKP